MPPLVKSSKTAPKLASKDNGTAMEIVGKRAGVQWDDGVYEGSVQSYDEQRRLFCICYDDGDIEWMKLPHKDVKLMSSARGVAPTSKCEHGSQRSSCKTCQREGKKKAKSDPSLNLRLVKEEKEHGHDSAEAGPSHNTRPLNDTAIKGECPVCLTDMSESSSRPITLACSHSFCGPCWSDWMIKTHANAPSSATCVECPLCLNQSVYCPMDDAQGRIESQVDTTDTSAV